MARWGVDAMRFRMRGSTDEATEKLLGEIKQVFNGVSARQIARMAPEVLVGVLPRIYPEMLEEVYAHQDAGRPTFIVSRGRRRARPAARPDPLHGRRHRDQLRDRRGRPVHRRARRRFMYGEGKVEAMRTFADEHDIDLERSFAYSDSVSDLPMLRAVGIPVVVNPDDELTRIADAEGWRVMRFEQPRPSAGARRAQPRARRRGAARAQ